MSYTLWSHGRLLGHSELEFIWREDGHRCGFLHPIEGVQEILDVATGVTPITFMGREANYDATWQADYAAACDRSNALELELRGPAGNVIPTEDICLRDTQFLMSVADRIDDDDAWYEQLDEQARAQFDADVEHDCALIDEWFQDAEPDFSSDGDEPWQESDFPRYQLQLTLVDHNAIP